MTMSLVDTFEQLFDALDSFVEAAQRVSKRRTLAKIEQSLATKIGAAFVAQGAAFVRRLAGPGQQVAEASPPAPDSDSVWWAWILANWEELFGAASLETAPLFTVPLEAAITEAMLSAGQRVISDVAPTVGMSFTLANPRAVSYLEAAGAELITNIDATTRAQIKAILTEGAERGDPVQTIAKAITARFKEFGAPRPQGHVRTRAELVAATEVGQAYETANLMAAEQLVAAGYQMEKHWQTVSDSRVSAECRANQAEGWIPISHLHVGGKMHPLQHPACRCSESYRQASAQNSAKAA